MPEVAAQNCLASEPEVAYATSWEHLSDELRCLDLCLHRQVLRQRHEQPVDPLAPFKGLVLSEAEIIGLLTHAVDPMVDRQLLGSNTADQQTIAQAQSQLEAEIAERRAVSLGAGVYLSLPHLAQLFHLTRFEEQCLLICLAPELARKYEKLYAYLQDDATRKKPSVDLVLNLLCQGMPEELAARVVFAPQAQLLKYRLLQMTDNSPDGPAPLLQRFLKLDDRIVNFLLGVRQMDARLEQAARLIPPQAEAHPNGPLATVIKDFREQMRSFLQTHFSEPRSLARNVIFHLHGPYGSGKRALAEAVSHDLGLPLIVGDVERMLSGSSGFEEAVWLLCREAALQPAALCLENLDGLLAELDKHRGQLKPLAEAMRTFAQVTFLLGGQAWQPHGILRDEAFITLEMPRADATTRKRLWEAHLNGHHRLAEDVDWGVLAGNFRLQPGQICEAMAAAENLARWRSAAANANAVADDECITMADLHAACRAQSSARLGALARKVEPKYSWDDIVLPPDQLAQLKELCDQARFRQRVYGDWGFERKLSRGKGLNALFSGPPGTGKTMAAEVIARELQLDLYQIDLSQVVSKYIGETEKNLHRIFHEAQSSNAILFFDEADALFGKRSEVKDAHDRYANIEVGYLLQKMEEYEGVAILATNLRQHLDEAFVRRLQFIVEFPFPDEEHRRRIWEVIFPHEAPLGADVDFDQLAREVKLAGGNIKNSALAAAFYAAADAGVIHDSHILQAVRREYQKLGRTWTEFGGRQS